MRASAPSLAVPAIAFGAAALLGAGAFAAWAIGSGWANLVGPAALSGAAVGALVWRPLLRRGRPVSPLGGALAGAAVALLTHAPTLYLAMLLAHATGVRSSLDQPVMTPGEALVALPLYTLLSWLAAGWITAPLGAATGAGVAWLGRRRPAGALHPAAD